MDTSEVKSKLSEAVEINNHSIVQDNGLINNTPMDAANIDTSPSKKASSVDHEDVKSEDKTPDLIKEQSSEMNKNILAESDAVNLPISTDIKDALAEVKTEDKDATEEKNPFGYIENGFTSEIFKIEITNLPAQCGIAVNII